MANFVNSVFSAYLFSLNSIFDNSYRALFLMLFVIVLISCLFKFISKVR